jgi:hypothetical protein
MKGAADQLILSSNTYLRLLALSNIWETGTIVIRPGIATKVLFREPILAPRRVYLTPTCKVLLKEIDLCDSGMTVIASLGPDAATSGCPPVGATMGACWVVYGMKELDQLPTWYVHFCNAAVQGANGVYKTALLDYAVAFEVFVESTLAELLTKQFGAAASDYLLGNTWTVEKRVKDLLQLAVGMRLSDDPSVYQPWDQDVRTVRNELAHGSAMNVDAGMAEKAHQAVYQAIRWVQDRCVLPVRVGVST